MSQLSFKKAKRFSLIKWDLIRKYGNDKAYDKIEKYKKYRCVYILSNECGFCERQGGNINCTKCEYSQGFELGCIDERHTYQKFVNTKSIEEEMQIADIIYNQINELEENKIAKED